MEARERYLVAGFVVALAAAIVSLVIAIDAKNKTVSDDELSAQVQSELKTATTNLRHQLLSAKSSESAAAHSAAAKGNQASRQAKVANARITKLQNQVKSLTGSVDTLNDEHTTQTRAIHDLQDQVKTLNEKLHAKANRG